MKDFICRQDALDLFGPHIGENAKISRKAIVRSLGDLPRANVIDLDEPELLDDIRALAGALDRTTLALTTLMDRDAERMGMDRGGPSVELERDMALIRNEELNLQLQEVEADRDCWREKYLRLLGETEKAQS